MATKRRFDQQHASPQPHSRITQADVDALQAIIANDAVEFRAIAKVLERSVGLARAVLRHVNGVRYGLDYRVTEISHAVTLLGVRRLRNFVEELRVGADHNV
ncbi:MAG: HDOD domain-containing protein [Planctomycetaceae bacterium]